MSPRFVLGRENVLCIAEVVNRSLKADCTDFKLIAYDPLLGSVIIEKMSFCFRNIPGWLTKACHEITLATHTDGQRFTYHKKSCLSVHIQ